MLTNLYLWLIYTASYSICFILQIVAIIYRLWNHYKRTTGESKTDVVTFVKSFTLLQDAEVILLVVLIFLSVAVIASIKKLDYNTRFYDEPDKNVTFDILGCVIAQVFTVLTVVLFDYGILIGATIFFIVGIFFVRSGKVHYCPIFVVPLGYSVYEAGSSVILARGTRDHIRIKLQNNRNGLEARELEPRIFLIKD